MLSPSDVYTNDLVTAANQKADKARAVADAQKYALDSQFGALQVPSDFTM